jgi:putative transposase
MKSRKIKKRRPKRPELVVVRLTDKERSELKGLLSHGGGLVRAFKKARVLQLMDEGLSAPKAAQAAGVSESTARRVGQRYHEGGVKHAIHDRPRPGGERILDARQESAIVAMVCSKPPMGFARWTISLTTKEAILRGIVESVSEDTIGRILKRHELKPWREKNVVRRRN